MKRIFEQFFTINNYETVFLKEENRNMIWTILQF